MPPSTEVGYVDVGDLARHDVGEPAARTAGHGPYQGSVTGVDLKPRTNAAPMIGGPSGVIGLRPH